jgi:RHS repeat-associated protein
MAGRNFEENVTKYRFTGKERDKESNYDYFGARYYDARIGRWGQVEPLFDKYVDVSSYSYGLNNPMLLKDIDGKDIIHIFFPDYEPESKGKNFPVGHSGILVIDNKTGNVNYYEYGAYDEGTWDGMVRRSQLENEGNQFSKIQFDKDKNPTEESIIKVLNEIGGGKVEGAYIKTSNEETKEVKKFLEFKLRESNPKSNDFNPDRKKYNTFSYNCSSFVYEAVKKAGVFVPPAVIDVPSSVSLFFRILYKNVEN